MKPNIRIAISLGIQITRNLNAESNVDSPVPNAM